MGGKGGMCVCVCVFVFVCVCVMPMCNIYKNVTYVMCAVYVHTFCAYMLVCLYVCMSVCCVLIHSPSFGTFSVHCYDFSLIL